MKDLSSFFKETTKIEIKVNDKVLVGDVSAYNLLKATTLEKNLDQADQMKKTFEIVFGVDNASWLLKHVDLEGLTIIATEVAKHFGVDAKKEGK